MITAGSALIFSTGQLPGINENQHVSSATAQFANSSSITSSCSLWLIDLCLRFISVCVCGWGMVNDRKEKASFFSFNDDLHVYILKPQVMTQILGWVRAVPVCHIQTCKMCLKNKARKKPSVTDKGRQNSFQNSRLFIFYLFLQQQHQDTSWCGVNAAQGYKKLIK